MQALPFARLFVLQVPEPSPVRSSGRTHWFTSHHSLDWQDRPIGRLRSHWPALQKLSDEQASIQASHGPLLRCGAQVPASQNAPATQSCIVQLCPTWRDGWQVSPAPGQYNPSLVKHGTALGRLLSLAMQPKACSAEPWQVSRHSSPS